MATIAINLRDLKSAGVYFREYDMSQNITTDNNLFRLVVGTSAKGPFNAPVLVKDGSDVKNFFGPIDPNYERRGSFFQRALYSAVKFAPVYALNLLPLNDDPSNGEVDKIPYQSFSLSSTETNGFKENYNYSAFYDRTGFWKASTLDFNAIVNRPSSINQGKLFNITNLGQSPLSLIVVKSDVGSLSGFNITANEWFNGNVPSFIDPYDYISDYFVDVYVLEGNWDNYISLSTDPLFGDYFTRQGIIKNRLENFLSLPEVNFIGKFTGSVIPDLRDGNDITYSIDTILNNKLSTLGLFVELNSELIEDFDILSDNKEQDKFGISTIDLIGHRLANSSEIVYWNELGENPDYVVTDPDIRITPDKINMLSYSMGIKDNYNLNLSENEFYIDELHTDLLNLSKNAPFELKSNWLGRSFGYFLNELIIRKDHNWADDNILAESYEKIRNSIRPNISLMSSSIHFADSVVENLTIDGKWLTISQAFETTDTNGDKLLHIFFTNPEKRNEAIILNPSNTVDMRSLSWNGDSDVVIEDFNPSTKTTDIIISNDLLKTIYQSVYPTGDVSDMTELKERRLTGWFEHRDKTRVLRLFAKSIKLDNPDDITTSTLTITLDNPYREEASIINTRFMQDFLFRFLDYKKVDILRPNLKTTGTLPDIESSDYKIYNQLDSNIVERPDTFTLYTNTDDITELRAYKYSEMATYIEQNIIQLGDLTTNVDTTSGTYTQGHLKFVETVDDNLIPYYKLTVYGKAIPRFSKDTKGNQVFERYDFADILKFKIDDGKLKVYDYGTLVDDYIVTRKMYESVKIIGNSVSATGTSFSCTKDQADKISYNDFIVSKITTETEGEFRYKLSRIISKVGKQEGGVNIVEFTTTTPIYEINNWVLNTDLNDGSFIADGSAVIRFSRIDDYANVYKIFNLSGFKLTEAHKPGTKKSSIYTENKQLQKILGVLDPTNSSLMERLASNDIIDFRYVVDTFDGGLLPMTGPKIYLTNLAKQRMQCLAFVNTPSFKKFQDSNNPRFTTIPTDANPRPILDTKYIAEGANLDLNPAYHFSLPDETNGSKFCGYFAPFVIVYENGKRQAVPPAVYVSNLFVERHLKGDLFNVSAGLRRGVLNEPNIVGVEYDFVKSDRDNLEPFGINPIIRVPKVGWVVYGNKMAYQRTKSAFNSLQVRDTLITIEKEINEILKWYIFEKHTDSNRIEIKGRIDAYLDKVKTLEGIYFYETRMNEINNPSDVIDANTAIIDVLVSVTKPMEKVLANVIVTGSGNVSISSFTPVFI